MREHSKNDVAIFDWLMVVVILALLLVVAYFVLSSPRWWLWCLDILDVRGWKHWTWTGVVIALLIVLAVIRFWPEGQQRKATIEMTDAAPDPSAASGNNK